MNKNLLTILAIVGGYLFLWFTANFNSDYEYTICPVKNLTGYPCPGCGMGRASVEIYLGHFEEAFHYHLLAIPANIFVIIAFFWLILDLVRGTNSFWDFMNMPMSTILTIIIVLLFLINWIRALYLGF